MKRKYKSKLLILKSLKQKLHEIADSSIFSSFSRPLLSSFCHFYSLNSLESFLFLIFQNHIKVIITSALVWAI